MIKEQMEHLYNCFSYLCDYAIEEKYYDETSFSNFMDKVENELKYIAPELSNEMHATFYGAFSFYLLFDEPDIIATLSFRSTVKDIMKQIVDWINEIAHDETI